MKKKLFVFLTIAVSFLLFCQMNVAVAKGAYFFSYSNHSHHNPQETESISTSIYDDYDLSQDYAEQEFVVHHHKPKGPYWIPRRYGDRIFPGMVKGGSQPYPFSNLYLCRAAYKGGLHPGKLFQGHCNIGWGGKEIVLDRYEVLVSHWPLHWIATSHDDIPWGAIRTGFQHDGPLYTCHAWYEGGIHPGKVVNGNCNIGWGGKEIPIPIYEILVR